MRRTQRYDTQAAWCPIGVAWPQPHQDFGVSLCHDHNKTPKSFERASAPEAFSAENLQSIFEQRLLSFFVQRLERAESFFEQSFFQLCAATQRLLCGAQALCCSDPHAHRKPRRPAS
jgi:hypothetical protein